MTVNEIEGMALSRVVSQDNVFRLSLRRELNGANRELHQKIRESDTDVCDVIDNIDLVANLNEYARPANLDTIRKCERFDLGGVGLEDPMPVPCGLVPIDLLPRVRRPAYALSKVGAAGGDGIVIWPTPISDMTAGIRLLSLPAAEEFVNDDQVPRIPKPLHDVLCAHLIRRLGSMAGIELAPGAADFINAQETFMLGFLNPGGRESVRRFARDKSIYHPRRF